MTDARKPAAIIYFDDDPMQDGFTLESDDEVRLLSRVCRLRNYLLTRIVSEDAPPGFGVRAAIPDNCILSENSNGLEKG
jgi:hypothetical protein